MTGAESARWTDETTAMVFVDEANKFLDQPDERPFFLFFSSHEIHVPRAPNERFVGTTPHGPRGDAMVELDWCVGQVVDALERAGVLENTLIVFTSDNGPVLDDGYRDRAVEDLGDHRPAGPYRGGKYSRYEGGTRVPWIAQWPANVAAGVTDAMISQVDLFATFATLAGSEPLAEASPATASTCRTSCSVPAPRAGSTSSSTPACRHAWPSVAATGSTSSRPRAPRSSARRTPRPATDRVRSSTT